MYCSQWGQHINRKRGVLWPTHIITAKRPLQHSRQVWEELREMGFLIQGLNLSNKRTESCSSSPSPNTALGAPARTAGLTRQQQLRPSPCFALAFQHKRGRAHICCWSRGTSHMPLHARDTLPSPPFSKHSFLIKQSLVEPTKHHHKCQCTRHSSQKKEQPNVANTGSHLSSSPREEDFFIHLYLEILLY